MLGGAWKRILTCLHLALHATTDVYYLDKIKPIYRYKYFSCPIFYSPTAPLVTSSTLAKFPESKFEINVKPAQWISIVVWCHMPSAKYKNTRVHSLYEFIPKHGLTILIHTWANQ